MPVTERHPDYTRFQKFKVLKHADRIEEMLRGEIPCPVEWVIYPSNVCGYRCGHCIMAKEQVDHRNTLSEAAMKKIPEDARRNGVKVVIFSGGGDPLLNRFTVETARAVQALGIKTGINNQGYLLKDPTPFDYVRYSVDAATKETYEKVHQFDGWDQVNRNIATLADLRAGGAKNEMGLAFLITPYNWEETYAFCEWAQQYRPDFVHIRPAFLDADYLDKQYPGGDAVLRGQIVPSLREMAKDIEHKWPNVFFRIDKFEGYWTPKKYNKCRATPLMAVTSGDGAFLVCQDRGIMKEENFLRWGDYNTQTFEEIWWSEEHKKVLESINLDKCPRCVMNGYNEIIEHGFVNDGMRMDLI